MELQITLVMIAYIGVMYVRFRWGSKQSIRSKQLMRLSRALVMHNK